MPRRIRGFTLIELLTVLGILSALMALLAPAVNRARESARRVQCHNHLRQLGLALQQYESAFRVFAPGTLPGGWHWRATLLPFLDQGPRHALIDFENNRDPATGCYSILSEVLRLQQQHGDWDSGLAVFQCPSTPRELPSHVEYRAVAGNEGFSPFDGYAHCPGDPLPPKRNGMFFYCSAIRLRDVRDGASQTLCIGESGHSVNFGLNGFKGSGANWLDVAGGLRPGIYEDSSTSHYWSFHPGGASFLFVDGHVQLLAYELDAPTYFGLASRAGNEVLGGF